MLMCCYSADILCAGLDQRACVWQELTLHHPNIVNAKKNTELLYSGPTFLASHQ